MVELRIKHKHKITLIELDESETIFTLSFMVADYLDLQPERFNLKLNNRILTDSSVKIKNLAQELENLTEAEKFIEVIEIQQVTRSETKKDSIMDIMDSDMMKNMLKDKNLMKSIIKTNPQLKKQLQNSEDLRGVFNENDLDEELDKISEDPEYLKTQMKNAEIQMRNLENIPGGLDYMNNMMDRLSNDINLNPKGSGKVTLRGEKITGLTEEPLSFNKTFSMPKEEIVKKTKTENENFLFKYSKQLLILKRNGFSDFHKNVEVLKRTNGNIEEAVKILCDDN